MAEEIVTIKLTKMIERALSIPNYPNKWGIGTRFQARRAINGWVVTNGSDAGLSVPADCAEEINT